MYILLFTKKRGFLLLQILSSWCKSHRVNLVHFPSFIFLPIPPTNINNRCSEYELTRPKSFGSQTQILIILSQITKKVPQPQLVTLQPTINLTIRRTYTVNQTLPPERILWQLSQIIFPPPPSGIQPYSRHLMIKPHPTWTLGTS